MFARALEFIGVSAQTLADRYLGSVVVRARTDSLAALISILAIDAAVGFASPLRVAYVFPVCLAARGAGNRWSVGIVFGSAVVMTFSQARGIGPEGAWVGSLLLYSIILGGVLRLVRRLETGLSTYQNLATHDPLTDLPNRIALERYGHRALRRAIRSNQALSVAMIDCDGFKRLNDTYGHAYGDLVLKIVAMCLGQTLGRMGIVARTGGDEFVAVLPGMDRNEAEMLLERAVTRFHDSTLGEGFGTGLSYGISELRDGETLESLIAEADRRMYARKRTDARRLV